MKYPKTSLVFEIFFLLFSALWIAGAFIDGYAHIHLESITETFFTPWHAVFYGGMALTGALLIGATLMNHSRGYSWRYSLPPEYMFSLFGFLLAALGGILDMTWHITFGIEVGVEALLSPTHLMLAFGGAIAVSGPFHAIWYREHRNENLRTWSVIMSFALVLTTLHFMLQFLHPFAFPWPSASFIKDIPIQGDYVIALGVANIIVYICSLLGFVLASLRYVHFPFGSFAFILGIDALAITVMADRGQSFIAAALLAGLIMDLLYTTLAAPDIRAHHIRWFGFGTSFGIALMYVIAIYVRGDMAWSVHLYAGLPVIAGIVGLLLTYLTVPPGNIVTRKFPL